MDLVSDQRSLRREIKRVVEDYEHQGRGEDQKDEGPAAAEEGTDKFSSLQVGCQLIVNYTINRRIHRTRLSY